MATPRPSLTSAVLLMLAAVLLFALMDAGLKLLSSQYPPLQVAALRGLSSLPLVTLWVLATVPAHSLLRVHWPLHLLRGALGIAMMAGFVYGLRTMPLSTAYAITFVAPLLVTAMAGPLLKERVGAGRWIAIVIGLVGVLVILRPGMGVFSWAALLPLVSALMFAVYSVLTRLTTRDEPTFPAFFWPGVIGAVLMTGLGLPHLTRMLPQDMAFLACYCGLSILSHWLLLKCYEQVEASRVQPYSYLQLVFVTGIGIVVYGEVLELPVAIGSVIVVAAGLYALSLERKPA